MKPVDEITRYNQERWDALAKANVEYSRPLLNLDEQSARAFVDPYQIMGDVRGKQVLCLAGGGGQQSAAFGVLGADVTVVDFSKIQLERDQAVLAHYDFPVELIQGDMRDLACFGDHCFDVVWHAYSINFVPDVTPVLDEVVRVLSPGGLYRLEWSNPVTKGTDETTWTGKGYLLNRAYADAEIQFATPDWEIIAADGSSEHVEGPREFNHTLSTVVNGLIGRGMRLLGIWEDRSGDANAVPGSWDHFKAFAPPYFTLWAQLFDVSD